MTVFLCGWLIGRVWGGLAHVLGFLRRRMRGQSALARIPNNSNGSGLRGFTDPAESILLPGRAEADRRPFLDRGAQIPGVAGEENRHAVMVLGQRGAVPGAEAVELGRFGIEPARRLVGRAVEPGGKTVFGCEPRLEHVELQGADDADDPVAA